MDLGRLIYYEEFLREHIRNMNHFHAALKPGIAGYFNSEDLSTAWRLRPILGSCLVHVIFQ